MAEQSLKDKTIKGTFWCASGAFSNVLIIMKDMTYWA